MKKGSCECPQQAEAKTLHAGRVDENGVNRPDGSHAKGFSLAASTERDQFKEYLENNCLKLTSQRERILAVFLRQPGPVSAEDLLAAAGGAANGISLSTLYRALGHLQCAGLARRIQQGAGSALYEIVCGHCCQLVCEKCGRRVPVSNPYLESMREVAARQEGFELHRCCAHFYGLCPACKAARVPTEAHPQQPKQNKIQ